MDFVDNLRRYAKVRTTSIAFPSSIFDNTPTPHLEAYLVGQIARAAVVFNVSEIIIFEEENNPVSESRTNRLVKLFEYAECPQYLRKQIFRIEPDLKYAGIINPLEANHHLRSSQLDCPYREGVTTKHVQLDGNEKPDFTEVNIGLNQPIIVPGFEELHTRVTVKVDPNDLKRIQSMLGPTSRELCKGVVVAPVEPLEKLNLYWGYYVRRVTSISKVMDESVFVPGRKDFYDLIIGTSERGLSVDDIVFNKTARSRELENPKTIDKKESGKPTKKFKSQFRHVLIVFGGVRGLEHSVSCDDRLKSCSDVRSIFDYYINTCPNQGSTTIRTEEAILITLSSLRPKLDF